MFPRRFLVAGVALASGASVLLTSPSLPTVLASGKATSVCPAGYQPTTEGDLATFASGTPRCVRDKHPETARELMQANGQRQARETAPFATVAAGAYESAVREREAIAASIKPVKGGGATWKPLGKSPLLSDVAGYIRTSTAGFADLAGRIEGFAYDPASHLRYFAAVAQGGIWETVDGGKIWRSIGDNLPTQIFGDVAYLPADHTIIAGSGDPAFGGTSYAGLGIFRSTNDGHTWTHSTGVPSDTLTFRLFVDPTNAKRVYAATSKGLYRSTDGGKTFSNLKLPTTCEDTTAKKCFFANIVTDVVVRATGGTGKPGGAVLAAVGWRAGPKKNADGSTQAPRNGLYVSDTGAPGSFSFLGGPTGFETQPNIGRTSMGIANGTGQNHQYVFAVVQSAGKFNSTTGPFDVPIAGAPKNTILAGIYVSANFGQTWNLMADPTTLIATSGTALLGAGSASYAPGVQSWYNSYVEVDPTKTGLLGAPARIVVGLEEVFENFTPIDTPAATTVPNSTNFKVIGKYFGGTTCAGLIVGSITSAPVPCPLTYHGPTPATTTHPDQHAAIFIPGPENVTLLVGNDGGAYTQTITKAATSDFDNDHWGRGANIGFNTLQPYDARMAKDGTVWGGLQDNGQLKIEPNGTMISTKDGDGFYSAVDPDDSDIAYEEYTGGQMQKTTNGGKTWTDVNPAVTGGLFAAPFAMDPADAAVLIAAGNEVKLSETGAGSTASWHQVYDLGTRLHPGSSSAATASDPNNIQSAISIINGNAYVGYCGYCDIVTQAEPFGNGVATNVGGTWHIAKATGLPVRYITSITSDPTNAKIVYVTLGGYGRRWIPPGALGDDVSKVGKGHVFMSTDAGEHFHDISGNLPDIPANWTVLHKGQLVVATSLGVFASNGRAGGPYAQLGHGLPTAPVFTLEIAPQDADLLVAATFGRGVYTYKFGKTDLVGPTSGYPGVPHPPKGNQGSGNGLPSTGLPAWLFAAPLLAAAGLLMRRRLRRRAA